MKFKRNLLILTVVLIGVLIVFAGCLPAPTTPPAEADAPTNGTISVAGGAATTNDTTPTLTLSSTGATYMAFSGDGVNWSAWVAYATTYSSFGVTTGEGCTSGDGTKTVYAKFKNDTGESATKVHDSIYLDTVAPTLSSAVYTDVGSGGTVNTGDTVVFTFSDEMLTSTVTASTVATVLPLSSSKSYGTSPTVAWDSTLKICTVTLGASPTIVVGTTTVNPTVSVTDTAGNADATATAVTISGSSSTVLSSVSISNSAVSTTTGGSTITLTATALSTAATTMTSSCTYTWSLYSGVGSISTGTTSTAIYTPPSSGAGTAVIKVSAVKTGTTTPTATDTSTVTVSAAAASTSPDATKLYVSAQNDNAKYTSLPSGYSVKVYSGTTDVAADATLRGTITSEDTWTTCTAFGHDDYIFFELKKTGWTSDRTSDGYIPAAPDATALGSIQATGTTTVSSSAAGNLTTGDKIKCYVGTTAYSTATNVGTDMTVTALVAGNTPLYTKTNTAGHESVVSDADGEILILTGATAGNVVTPGTLVATDTITLTFGDDVNVKLPIYVSDISWSTSGSSKFGAASDMLKNTDATDSPEVVLVASTNCTNIADAETVTFNISSTIPIVDADGGNQVLPKATGVSFTGSSF